MNFFINGGLARTNSGVEHAILKRLQLFRDHDVPAMLVATDFFFDLHRNAVIWGLPESQLLGLHDWFIDARDFVGQGAPKLSDYPMPAGMVELPTGNAQLRQFAFDGQTTSLIDVNADANGDIYAVSYFDPTRRQTRAEWYDPRGFIIAEDRYIMLADKNVRESRAFYSPTGQLKMLYTMAHDRTDIDEFEMVSVFDYHGHDYQFFGTDELFRFFFDEINQAFGGANAFIADRGITEAWALNNMQTRAFKTFILHAGHLNDETAPNGLVNYNYQYEFDNIGDFNAVIVPTQIQLERVANRFGYRERFFKIPVGMISDAVLSEPVKTSIERQPQTVVTVSRLDEAKQIDHLIDAMAIVHEQLPQAQLEIWGNGSDDGRLRDQIARLDATDYVHLMGHTTAVLEKLANAQLFVAASRSEGFGLTMMEAESVGTPIIAYDALYGPREIVQPGVNGQLIGLHDPDNVQQMAHWIQHYLSNQQALAALMASTLEARLAYSETAVWQAWQNWLTAIAEWRQAK